MVLIEATACGTPVMALRGGAVPAVMADGVTGVVYDLPDGLPAAVDRRVQLMNLVVRRRDVAAQFGVAQFGWGYPRFYWTVVGTVVPANRQAKLRRVLREQFNVAEPTTA
jgi:glycosyltransferase involved in cell wall biosynthesis